MCTPDLVEAASLLVGLFGCSPQKMTLPNLGGETKKYVRFKGKVKGKKKTVLSRI